jgi:succinate-semialdehyde dehydrogenase/glutarate-semialdehyde dehydrogenase
MSDYPETLRMYVDGAWLDATGRRTHTVVNPAHNAPIGALPLANAADLDRALEAAQRGFALWRAAPADQRGQVLKKTAELLRQRIDRVARIATTEEGKTLREARGEVMMAANIFEWFGEEGRRAYGRVLVRPAGLRTLVTKEPVGPVAAFAPWNFPIGNPARKLGAALAAGCSCILKPPEEAPASALEVMQALIDAGLPAGVAQIVFGLPDEVSRHLIASPIIRKISFTGSTVVGKHLMKLAADQMLRTTMELGGHAPVLVFDDAEIERALDTVVPHKFANSGQICVSPTRFYVQEGVYDRFVAGFVERAKAVAVGDGLVDAHRMGPMANPRRPEAIEQFVADAVSHGAKVLTGGHRKGNEGFFFEPTVLTEVPNSARIMNEEPFGPVAMLTPFRHADDAYEQANRLPYGLAAYAWTSSAKRALEIGARVEAGMVNINVPGGGGVDMPFGGIRESGHGKEDGAEGLEACLITKTIAQG